MKFRLGAITGTPAAGDGAESEGIFYALTDNRDDLVQLRGMYYGKMKIWPGEGKNRISALRLQMSPENSNLLNKYVGATNDFRSGEAYLRVQIAGRWYSRSIAKGQIQWDANGQKLLFLNNNGPWVDKVMRGDYITLEFRMEAYTETIQPQEHYAELACAKAYFEPVTTCNIYMGAQWYTYEKQSLPGAAAFVNRAGDFVSTVEAHVVTGNKKKSGSARYVGQERELRGVTHGGAIWLKGDYGSRKVTISYPAASGSVECKVLDVETLD